MSDVPVVDSFASDQLSDGDLRKLVQKVLHQYIFNEMPIHLLHITKDDCQEIRFKLVDKSSIIKSYFSTLPEGIYDKFRNRTSEDIEENIKREVKMRLRYAIFSHRWLSDDGLEPSYQDLSKEFPANPGPGWKKLQDFCRAALVNHTCQFAWSDTCCINKSNFTELDESIRSMFRWYRNSHICVAFLSETADLERLRKSQKNEVGAEIDPWFLRGWTLQELLAPSRIKFYGLHWKPLIPLDTSNDKSSEDVMDTISKITHIHLGDLKSFEPSTDRVPEKMMWASKRETTRIEDTAYCLIGIFNVSLMTAYGEGNQAFFRLMEEILKRYDKWDVFHWSGSCSPYNAALPDAPRCYPVGYSETDVTPHVNGEEQKNNWECDIGDSRFALTNHGLQIKVLQLKIDIKNTRDDKRKSRNLTFECNSTKIRMPEVKHIGEKKEITTKWAIGILDYWVCKEARGFGFVDYRERPFTAFLLSLDKGVPRARWRKEMTEKIIKVKVSGHERGCLAELFL